MKPNCSTILDEHSHGFKYLMALAFLTLLFKSCLGVFLRKYSFFVSLPKNPTKTWISTDDLALSTSYNDRFLIILFYLFLFSMTGILLANIYGIFSILFPKISLKH